MEDFQKRVIQEKEELDLKIKKLGNFLKTEKFNLLDNIDKELLYVQKSSMSYYSEVLGSRIARF